MKFRYFCFVLFVGVTPVAGQSPVISPRGLLNAVTLEPAPSRIPLGGTILIQGLSLGPADELKATGLPLPTKLGDVEVLINNRNAPLFSVRNDRILAQVPWELPVGPQGVTAQVVVKRGTAASPAGVFQLVQSLPAIVTKNGAGYGEAGVSDGTTLTLTAVGLGRPDPETASGQAGSADAPAAPALPLRAYVGGWPAAVTATLSTSQVGQYDVSISLPAGAQAGDLVTLDAGNSAPANRTPYVAAGAPEVQYLPFPAGSGTITTLRSADLRGNYLIANAARGDDGCYPSVLFDLGRKTASRIANCLLSGNQGAATPVIAPNESNAMAALAGPATGTAQTGLTTKVAVFQPANPAPMLVELPAATSNLINGADGSVVAITTATPPAVYSINVETGEVTEGGFGGPGGVFPGVGGGPGGAPGGVPGGAPGGVGGGFPAGGLTVDLGDGVKTPVAIAAGLGQGLTAVVAVDDVDKPTKAKMASINARGEVANTVNFPAGWLPLIAPAVQIPGGGAGAPGGGAFAFGALRVATYVDTASGTLFVTARKTDSSADGLIALRLQGMQVATVGFPAGWFATSCRTSQNWFLPLDLSHTVAMLGSNRPETAIRNPCAAQGYLVLDPAQRSVRALSLPGAGSANAAGSNGDLNGYLYVTNSDTGNPLNSDTLFVLDGVSETAIRFNLPTGVATFTGLQPITELNSLVGIATNRTAGDGGVVIFNLDTGDGTVLPVPDGFASVALLGGQGAGFFPSTRKLVVRGTNTAGDGASYIIYDLTTGDSTVAANPAGVAYVAQLPAVAGAGGPPGGGGLPGGGPPPGGFPGGGFPGGGGPGAGAAGAAAATVQVIGTKSNFVAAVGYSADRRAVGVVAVRVP